MDDKIIDMLCKNKDCSSGIVLLNNTYKYNANPLNSWENDNYNYFNDSSELTLYAHWINRKNIIDALQEIVVSGEGVIKNENGDYEIEKNKDFEIKLKFKENKNFQLSQLSFYELPNYFTSIFTDEVKVELEKETNLPIRISGPQGITTFNGKFYVKNDILCIDFLEDGTFESNSFFMATNVSFRITYRVTYNEERINSHTFYSVSLLFELNGVEDRKVTVYPKGKIITKYIDQSTGKSIIPDSIKTEILGKIYNSNEISIDGYKLVEKSVNSELEFDEEQQVIYYKYKKLLDSNDVNTKQKDNLDTIKNSNTGTKSVAVISLILLLVSSFISILLRKQNN